MSSWLPSAARISDRGGAWNMNYTCILKNGSRRENWTGQILLLDAGDGWYEAEINGRGTYFHILAGRHKYGNYLCVPNHDLNLTHKFMWISYCFYAILKKKR